VYSMARGREEQSQAQEQVLLSERQRGEARSEDSVEISAAYLVYLHDMLAERLGKVEQMFGGSASQMLTLTESEQVANALAQRGVVEAGLEGAVQALRKWGMHVSTKYEDGTAELEVVCPFAKAVHPRLSAEDPVCPLAALVVGAARADHPLASVKHFITGTGVTFVISRRESPSLE